MLLYCVRRLLRHEKIVKFHFFLLFSTVSIKPARLIHGLGVFFGLG